MSHTPGPWKFKVTDETDSFLGCKRLDGGDGGTVIDLSDEWTGYPECGQDLQMTISKDDAALIAAAPDLLEALETMERLAGTPMMMDDPARVAAQKAIMKARGEE